MSMEFCDLKCCFGPEHCISEAKNPINIAGNHKVCDFHLQYLSQLLYLQCSYCQNICKLTLDFLPTYECVTCHQFKPSNLVSTKSCGHFHCEPCSQSCPNLFPIMINPNFPDPASRFHPAFNSINTNSKSEINFQTPNRIQSSNTIVKRETQVSQVGNSVTSQLKPCANCGEKLMERILKCSHIGCLGCYGVKKCLFCEEEKKLIPNFKKCDNCGRNMKEMILECQHKGCEGCFNSKKCVTCDAIARQTSVNVICNNCESVMRERKLVCGHKGCEKCVNQGECRECKIKKISGSSCKNCYEKGELIPFECNHVGCFKCYNRGCRLCQQESEKKYAAGNIGYNEGQCQKCSQRRKLIPLNCGHPICEYCVSTSKCKFCVELRCDNCSKNFPCAEWKSCNHKLCLPCTNSKEKCRKCFKICSLCNSLYPKNYFVANNEICYNCIQRNTGNNINFCDRCKKNKINEELNIYGKPICRDCYQAEIQECYYCLEIRDLKKYECNHKACVNCFKNKKCYGCLGIEVDNKKKIPENETNFCVNCRGSSVRNVKMLCNHTICDKCFSKNYEYMDYRCIYCFNQKEDIKCLRCKNNARWRTDQKTLTKLCCKIRICIACKTLIARDDRHTCKTEKDSDDLCISF